MKVHYGRMNETDREERESCSKCREEFKDKITKTDHERKSEVKERGRCPVCNQLKCIANVTRHKRRCKEKYSIPVEKQEDKDCGGNALVTRQGGKRTGPCDRCGREVLKKNMARHRETCGLEVMRKEKRCQYLGKDLAEDYIKKHEIVCKKKQDERVVDRQIPQGAEMA